MESANCWVRGGTANDHPTAISDLGLAERVHNVLHAGHRGRQQSRDSDDVRVMAGGFGDEPGCGHVHAEVDHVETSPFEHGGNESLPDVVQVPLDRSDHHAADRFHAPFRQERPDQLQRALHRPGGDQQFRNKELVVLKPPAGFVHGGDHVVRHKLLRIAPRLERAACDFNTRIGVAVQDRFVQLVEVIRTLAH